MSLDILTIQCVQIIYRFKREGGWGLFYFSVFAGVAAVGWYLSTGADTLSQVSFCDKCSFYVPSLWCWYPASGEAQLSQPCLSRCASPWPISLFTAHSCQRSIGGAEREGEGLTWRGAKKGSNKCNVQDKSQMSSGREEQCEGVMSDQKNRGVKQERQ